MVLLSFFAAVACFFDTRKRRIPNLLLAVVLLTGLIRAGCLQGTTGPPAYLLRMILVILAFYPFFMIGSLGAGDVKLFGVAAAFFESRDVIPFLFFTLLIAAFLSILKLVLCGNVRERFARLTFWVRSLLCGNLRIYVADEEKNNADTVALAGPVFCSVLLKLGGFY